MFCYDDIKNEVITSLGAYVDDYNVDDIVVDLSYYQDENGEQISSIDDLESDEYWNVVESNERR